MGCVHSRQGQAWQPEHPGETHRRRLPGEKKQKQGGVGRKEERDLGSRRTDANDSGSPATNNNTRKPALNFDSLPPPRLEVQPCTPRAEVMQPYNFTSSPSTPRLEALRLEGIVARRSLHGSTTSLQSCLKDPLRDEDSGSLHSAGSRVSFSEDVRVRPISSRGKGRPVGSSSPRTTARSSLESSRLESTRMDSSRMDSSRMESSKTDHSTRARSHDSPQGSPRSVRRREGDRAAYVEPRWVKELGGASSTETGML